MIFVGDLCDRGLYTKEVIEFVIQNNYRSLLGNHDEYMIKHAIESINGIDNKWYKEEYMGGRQTLESYKDDLETLNKHIEFLKDLPNYIIIDNYFITHGLGLPYYKRRDDKDKANLLNKNKIEKEARHGHDWEKDWKNYEVINIFGHTNFEEVEVGHNYYGIDTGCAYGNKLTAIKLGSMEIIDQEVDLRDIK